MTVAGGGIGDGGPAFRAILANPSAVAVDAVGNVYIADTGDHRIRRIDSIGFISTFAGTGQQGYSGDGGPALQAQLDRPVALAVDAAGSVFFIDGGNHRIRKVDPSGSITTVAGDGSSGFSGDGGPAKDAKLERPLGLALDGKGNIYVADSGNHRIRRIDSSGTITTLTGTGAKRFAGDDGPATAASLDSPSSVAVDDKGNIFIADSGNHRIRRVDASGVISTVAGSDNRGYSGDGGLAILAGLNFPEGILVDSSGRLLIADTEDHRIRQVDSSGRISTLAGFGGQGIGGDGGPAIGARLTRPRSLALDGKGNLYIASGGDDRIRRVDTSGLIRTVAGGGFELGDGGPAAAAVLGGPADVAVDGAGNLYIPDTLYHRVRKVDTAGIIRTIAGTGQEGFGGDGALATAAQLKAPGGLAFDKAGNLYIADSGNHRIRRVDPFGIITTITGTGTAGVGGEGVSATTSMLNRPRDVVLDTKGNLYIADSGNHRIRRVDTSGIITTVAGTGDGGFSGDGGLANLAKLNEPAGVAVDSQGQIYIADMKNHRIRLITSAGVISTLVGTGQPSFGGDGLQATSASLSSPMAVTVDDKANLYVSDSGNGRVRLKSAAGIIVTFAGGGSTLGDEGHAKNAALLSPRGLAIDGKGNIYVADAGDHRVRKVDSIGRITTAAGGGLGWGDGGQAASAALNGPSGITVDGGGNLYIAEAAGNRIRSVEPSGAIHTLAGVGGKGFDGDGSLATKALLDTPWAVAYGIDGSLYVADAGNLRLRRVGLDGVITTVLETKVDAASSQGVMGHQGLAADDAGNLYISDTSNHRIRKLDAFGNLWPVAGTGLKGFAGDGGDAFRASFDSPSGLAVDRSGNLYIADTGNHRIRRLDTSGKVTTVAGSGIAGFLGDGGPAIQSRLKGPIGVAIDRAGNLYIADTGNHRIRRVDTSGAITTVAGDDVESFGGDGGPASNARLASPRAVALDARGNLYIADTGNNRVRRIRLP